MTLSLRFSGVFDRAHVLRRANYLCSISRFSLMEACGGLSGGFYEGTGSQQSQPRLDVNVPSGVRGRNIPILIGALPNFAKAFIIAS